MNRVTRLTHLNWERLLAATGLVDVALTVVALLLMPPPPVAGASALEVAAYYTKYGNATLVSCYLAMLALVFFFIFMAYLSTVLGRAETEPSSLARLCFGSALAAGTTFLIFLVVTQTLAIQANATTDIAIGGALSDLANMGLTASSLPGALLVGAASALVLRTRVAPRWIGLLGLLVGLILLLASLSLLVRSGTLVAGGVVFYIGSGSFLLWELVISLYLTLQLGRGQRMRRLAMARARGLRG